MAMDQHLSAWPRVGVQSESGASPLASSPDLKSLCSHPRLLSAPKGKARGGQAKARAKRGLGRCRSKKKCKTQSLELPRPHRVAFGDFFWIVPVLLTAPGCSLPGQRFFCLPSRHTRPCAGHMALFPLFKATLFSNISAQYCVTERGYSARR